MIFFGKTNHKFKREWHEAVITSIDETVNVKDRYGKKKVVFYGRNDENGETIRYICWAIAELGIGDRLIIRGYKTNDIFIVSEFKRISKGEANE